MNSKEQGNWQDTPAGKELQSQLADGETLAGLSRLLGRIDDLEKTVDRLSGVIEQGPGLVAIATDAVDDEIRRVNDEGGDVEARLRSALTLADRLTAPDMVAKLDAALTTLDRLPGLVSMTVDVLDETARNAAAKGVVVEERIQAGLQIAERLTHPDMVAKMDEMLGMMDRLPGLMSMVVDMGDEAMRQAAAQGIDLEQKVKTGLHLADTMTSPEMVNRMEKMIDLSDRADGFVAMTMDMLDEELKKASAEGVDPITFLKHGIQVGGQLSKIMNSEEFQYLLSSDLFDKEAVALVSAMGRAMSETKSLKPKALGPWALLRSMKDPDVKRAMGFLVGFGKSFGKQLS